MAKRGSLSRSQIRQVNHSFPAPVLHRARAEVRSSSSAALLTSSMDEPRGAILEWDEHDVHLFLTKLGLPQYEAPIRGTSDFGPTRSMDTTD